MLVGDDTDLPVLLCYNASLDSYNLFFRPEPKKTNTKTPRVWNMHQGCQGATIIIGPEVCTHILFLHAVLGCDTTSRLYGIGKEISLKKFKSSEHFREQAKVFSAQSASSQELGYCCRGTSISQYVQWETWGAA